MKSAAAILAAGILAGSAAAADPVPKHTSAGTTAAKASLITLTDLGTGWTPTASTGATGLQLSCPGYRPNGKGIVETGIAATPSYSGGAEGPFVFQQTAVYATAAQAALYWKRAVQPGLIACVRQTLATLSSRGITVKIVSQGPLSYAKVAGETAAYRVVASLVSPKQKLKTYFDVLLIGHGATLTEVTLSSFVKPVPATVEHALGLVVARNMTKPAAKHTTGPPTA